MLVRVIGPGEAFGAIYLEEDVPEQWREYIARNAQVFGISLSQV